MIATADPNLCIGCGLCTEICPTVFEISGDTCAVLVDLIPAHDEASCIDAKNQCPVNAINIFD